MVFEADESQSGKGYFVRCIAAIYDDQPATNAQTRKGVGGLEEAVDADLIAGRAFISIDNVRGKPNSEKLESFLTEPTYAASVP